jgi:hypothetical protein
LIARAGARPNALTAFARRDRAFMLELRLITGDPISGEEDYHDGLD